MIMKVKAIGSEKTKNLDLSDLGISISPFGVKKEHHYSS